MLCITFDNFGCGSGRSLPTPRPNGVPESEWASYNEIGLRLGHPRILDLLGELGIKGTFFTEGYAAVLHPEELLRWKDAGHEIALHGWKHEMWFRLDSENAEEDLVRLSMAAFHDVLGTSPVGFRPPGLAINAWTEDVMARNGIQYISHSLHSTAQDYEDMGFGEAKPGPLVEVGRLGLLPMDPKLCDAFLVRADHGGVLGEMTSDEAYEHFFLAALEHERRSPEKPWVFVAHPFISGNRAWLAFERFVRRLRSEFGADRFLLGRDAARR